MAGGPSRLNRLDRDTWRRIESVLDQVLELPPGEVPAALDRLCGEDAELRERVEAVLRADARAGGWVTGSWRSSEESEPGAPADSGVADPRELHDPDLAGRRLGPWRLDHEIGRGGMGLVYLAHRADGQFEQEVAVKLFRAGPLAGDLLARFRLERQVLARLEHPNIAHLIDGGVTEDGLWWFALEHVPGAPITEHVQRHPLPLERVLHLFLQAAAAVQHAHRNLVIHRDLKPSNILVTESGAVKLLDFGIAKLLEPGAGGADRTLGGLQALTPGYASPEQLRGEPPTTATDVYSLGVVLYELLTGTRPYRGPTGTFEEARRTILEEDPEAPSARVRRERAGRRTGWARRLRGDLDNIVSTALRKDPRQRYLSVEALVEDLERWRRGDPVRATGRSLRYRAAKFVRRHRVPVAAAALLVFALAGGLIATAWQARVAERERDRARLEARKAEEIKDLVLGLFEVATPEQARGRTISALELLDHGAERVERELKRQPIIQAQMLDVLGEVYSKLGRYDRAVHMREAALAALEPLRPSADTLVANVLRSLGSSYYENGQPGRADSVLRQALGMQRRLRGPDHWQIAMAAGELASIASALGRYEEAERLYHEALRLDSLHVGLESDEAASDMANLGLLHSRQGHDRDALPYLERALAARRKLHGPDHLKTALAMLQLAVPLQNLGQYARAESLQLAALGIRLRQLPQGHPDLAYSYRHLAAIATAKKEKEKALDYSRRAFDIRLRALGPENSALAEDRNELAIAFYVAGEYDSALTQFREELRVFEATLPPTHPNVLQCRSNIGGTLREMRRYAEAERIMRDVLAAREKTLRPDDLQLADSHYHLGKLLVLRKQTSEARSHLTRALEIRAKSLPPDHPRVIDTREALASVQVSR